MAFSFSETSFSSLITSVKAVAADRVGTVVAVGQDSVSLRSTDGGTSFTWGNIDYGDWVDIAYGGGRFVAVDQASGYAAYSTDAGANFTRVSLGMYLRTIAYGAGKFVALNSGGGKYSSDGVTWSTISNPESWSLRESTLVWNGSYFLVRGYGGTKVYKSTDGVTWTIHTSAFNSGVRYLAWNGSRFTGLVRNSSAGEYSEDGINWTSITLPVSRYWSRIVWNGVRWLAVAGEQLTPTYATSTDGETWVQGSFNSTRYWSALCADGLSVIAISTNVIRSLGTGDTLDTGASGTGSIALPYCLLDATGDFTPLPENAVSGEGSLPLALVVHAHNIRAINGTGEIFVPTITAGSESPHGSGTAAVRITTIVSGFGFGAVDGIAYVPITLSVSSLGCVEIYGDGALRITPLVFSEGTHSFVVSGVGNVPITCSVQGVGRHANGSANLRIPGVGVVGSGEMKKAASGEGDIKLPPVNLVSSGFFMPLNSGIADLAFVKPKVDSCGGFTLPVVGVGGLTIGVRMRAYGGVPITVEKSVIAKSGRSSLMCKETWNSVYVRF